MNIDALNKLDDTLLFDTLQKCCGATDWVVEMMNAVPFESYDSMIEHANEVWASCTEKDGLEAFEHHPQIGDKKSLEEKFSSTKEWAGNEQEGVDHASSEILDQLVEANQAYLDKFGYIFIVCATGKSAVEMLNILNVRLSNTPEEEIKIAMAEQHKITILRLNKLLS